MKFKKLLVVSTLAFGILFIPITNYATNTETAAVANSGSTKLFQLIKQLQNMHAHFTQTLINQNQNINQTSQGEVWVSKPSYFKWKTINPNKQLLVSNGKKLWNYDEDLEQVTIQNVPNDMSQAPYLLLLTGQPKNLAKVFTITKLTNNTFRLVPKTKDNSILKYVDMVFNNNKLSQLIIKTATGQMSKITFSKQSYTKIPLSIYHFQVPKGVDVLGS